jgi:hypothetical protein
MTIRPMVPITCAKPSPPRALDVTPNNPSRALNIRSTSISMPSAISWNAASQSSSSSAASQLASKRPPEITVLSLLSQLSSYGRDRCPHSPIARLYRWQSQSRTCVNHSATADDFTVGGRRLLKGPNRQKRKPRLGWERCTALPRSRCSLCTIGLRLRKFEPVPKFHAWGGGRGIVMAAAIRKHLHSHPHGFNL